MKNFLGRHRWIISSSVGGVLVVLGALSSFIKNDLLSLLWALAVTVLIASFILDRIYGWFCEKCATENDSFFPGKYCTKCGSAMWFRRRAIYWKICKKEHRVRDEYDRHKFCPRCGEPLERMIIITEAGKREITLGENGGGGN